MHMCMLLPPAPCSVMWSARTHEALFDDALAEAVREAAPG